MKKIIKKITPDFLLNWYHFLLAFFGAVLYGFPSRKLKVIGVTGTNGKSTVISLISQILKTAGYKTASASSIYFTIGDKTRSNDSKMTMPGRFEIQKFLSRAVKEKCQYVVLEVTSEGIKQHRHRFIRFDVAVLTNLTPEHLENHGGFENYKKAKGRLFHSLNSKGKAIVNLDDPNADYFLQFLAEEKWGYAIRLSEERKTEVQNLIQAEDCEIKQKGVSFKVNDINFNLNLLGEFNIYNALAAISVGTVEKISLEKIKLALEKVKGIPGRLEIIMKEPFTVIVDYAHTPDALEKVYQTIRKSFKGKIIGVLGAAGGGRDKWKRPELGKIAEKYLDQIIVTNEDPYDENPGTIINEIAAGIKEEQVEKIIDRREAICYALRVAQEGDVVIITGKGCESLMCVAGDKKIPWDDRNIVREEI